jgi:hypothetical protein
MLALCLAIVASSSAWAGLASTNGRCVAGAGFASAARCGGALSAASGLSASALSGWAGGGSAAAISAVVLSAHSSNLETRCGGSPISSKEAGDMNACASAMASACSSGVSAAAIAAFSRDPSRILAHVSGESPKVARALLAIA